MYWILERNMDCGDRGLANFNELGIVLKKPIHHYLIEQLAGNSGSNRRGEYPSAQRADASSKTRSQFIRLKTAGPYSKMCSALKALAAKRKGSSGRGTIMGLFPIAWNIRRTISR